MKLAICLDLRHAVHRDRLIGIYHTLQHVYSCDTQILSNEGEICKLVDKPSISPDGIITEAPIDPMTQNALANSGIPLASLGWASYIRKTNCISVQSDFEKEGKLACDYFARLGHFASYAYVPHPSNLPWSVQRGEAFQNALANLRLHCHIYALDKNPQTLSEFLADLPKPLAVLSANDEQAVQVIKAAKSAGHHIPEDISVLGIDDDELICEHTSPTLSSIRMDSRRIGAIAAERIVKTLRRKRPFKSTRILVPPLGITERESTKMIDPSARMIKRALAFIAQEFRRNISPDDVAREIGVSRSLLFLRFKQHVGKTISTVILENRLEEARRMLTATKQHVGKIFLSVGFTSTAHACRAFKNAFGSTPKEFRLSVTQGSLFHSSADRPVADEIPAEPEESPMRR